MINEKDYVVLDVETNGLSSLRDDLLSISIYKPDDNKKYERFLPLELNRFVETTHINGITEKMLSNKLPLNQEEFNKLIIDFELDKRTILTYGNIDERFIKNYLLRKKIYGFDKLTFYNFKHDIISSSFSEGNITKDNLCKIYGIKGVNNIHNGINDAILEWELFKKMNGNKLIITGNDVYEFNKNYIVPASYLQTYPNFKYCINNYPKINYEMVPIKTIHITSKKLKKFDTNINGVAIEHLINSMLNVKDMNEEALLFQIANKQQLKKIGTLPSEVHSIAAIFNDDGTITAINKEDRKEVKKINKVMAYIKEEINPLVDYIKCNIFKNKEIMSQELIVNKDDNVMAKCDLSTDDTILEIKAFVSNIDKLKYQLYYQANNRNIYILQTFWFADVKKGLKFTIYKINPIEVKENLNNLESRRKKFESKINNKNITVLNYVSLKDKVGLKCKECNMEWETSCNSILSYNQCPTCNPKVIEKKELVKKVVLTDEEKLKKRFNDYQYKIVKKSDLTIRILEYTGSKNKVLAKCMLCNNEWSIRADHLIDRCYCPACKNNR